MPSILAEQQQWVDSGGKPLNGGEVFFGDQNADPELNPIAIFAVRDLTTPLANPQAIDEFGRTANKVWIAGPYSIKVEDSTGAQVYQELDNGQSSSAGVTTLENVVGGNTITATAVSTISVYNDQELYAFRAASVNAAGGVTLNIDGVGAKPVLKNHDQAILKGEFEADQNIIVSRNATNDVFEWVNQNIKVTAFYEGANVATATTPDIWVTGGNTFHFTGITTVVNFADAPNIGAWRTGIADGAFTLTHGSGITLEGGSNISIEAGDRIDIYADAVDAFRAWVTKASGSSLKGTWDLITTLTASASAALEFTLFNSAKYSSYKFILENLVPGTDNLGFSIRTSTDGGSNFDEGASDYAYEFDGAQAGVDKNVDSAADTAIVTLTSGQGNAAGETLCGEFILYAPDIATAFTQIDGKTSGTAGSGAVMEMSGFGLRKSAADVDGIQFFFAGGTTATGTIRCLGLVK